MKQKIGLFVPITLGLLTAFGPFVTDFYLPAMPAMSASFHTSPSLVALSLTMGMVGLAVGQIFIGPLSDKFGRKRLLILSMLLFALASVFCVLSPNIYLFNLMRLFQGIGGAGGIVLSKSIATDMFSGIDLQSFMAVLGAINGIAPVTAPILGGVMTAFVSWRGIFCLLLAIGVILMVCSCFLRETLPLEKRSKAGVLHVYVNLFKVFRNPCFTLSTCVSMTGFLTFFAYIASSPFVLQKTYGLSPIAYSLCFGLIAFTIGIGSLLGARFKHQNTALKAAAIHLLIGSVITTLCLIVHAPLGLLMIGYVWMVIGFGLMQPAATAIAMDTERLRAGAASAIFGASGFVSGAVASPLVSLGDIPVTSGLVMVSGAVVCLFLTLNLCRQIKREALCGIEKVQA
ncbi:MAG: multidrug effflux MFS transporter [Prevotella sp.]|jgi:DHA1 family bicyclomycin/chloramphenicol resistance-like MFS transporter|nr:MULTISPECIES: multidrug effflux MFS transporter [unclassified Prevotella]MCH3970255.1 multidrug effflux MFS transporter [Prevotella sp.]MCH3986121.1 multidrug effflux MFS transporter [Prevotella sp.]MCH4017006.1 multidrug effflux MFS transporter [Prevotella sp.]MCH4185385.1 multidrug effflux MFS transporter [Prevotella sp.]MCH4215629.1 multidrug effflux MFS transporter [Prevotella sp.]